jgi:hypothetical protein
MRRDFTFGTLLLLSLVSSNGLGDEPTAKDKKALATRLDGAWRMIALERPGEDKPVKPEGWEQTKLVVGGRFVWTVVKDGEMLRSAGGKYTAGADEYTEEVEFVAHPADEWMVGKTIKFKAKLDGDKWHHEGTIKTTRGEVKIKEIWERIK